MISGDHYLRRQSFTSQIVDEAAVKLWDHLGWAGGGEAGRGRGVSPNVNYRVPRFCSMLSVITCPAQPSPGSTNGHSPTEGRGADGGRVWPQHQNAVSTVTVRSVLCCVYSDSDGLKIQYISVCKKLRVKWWLPKLRQCTGQQPAAQWQGFTAGSCWGWRVELPCELWCNAGHCRYSDSSNGPHNLISAY